MQVTVLLTLPSDQDRSRSWLPDALTALGHDVDVVDRPGLEPDRAAALGYQVAETWTTRRPDVVLAVGWVAGLATLVATREVPVPVLLRLPRPGRSGSVAVTRVERALARSGARLLASAPSELDVLAGLGAPRSAIRVLPEPIDAAAATATRPRWPTPSRSWWPPTTPPPTSARSSRPWRPAAPPWSWTGASSVTWWPTRSPGWWSGPRATFPPRCTPWPPTDAPGGHGHGCGRPGPSLFATAVVVEALGRLVDEAGRPAYASV